MIDARNYTVDETLKDGTRVTIRAIRPDDRDRIATAFRHLDRESVYTRFFTYKSELTGAELGRIASIDFLRRVVLVVTTETGKDEIIIGSGSLAVIDTSDDVRSAEVAFTVEEDYQGFGIAGRLLAHLAGIARERHIRRLEADVLSNNKPMLAVFARSGLPMQKTREGGVVHVSLALAAEEA